MGGVVVANPGGVTWMTESAAAFASTGDLERYMAPVAVNADDLDRFRHPLLPKPVADRVVLELRRRATPPEVGDRLTSVATAIEVANVLLTRTPLPLRLRRGLFRPRMTAFDMGVARRLTADVGAVIGYQGSTVRTFRRAQQLGVPAVLDYPIAHFEVAERVLQEEARLNPEFAPTIIHYAPWIQERYREEIARADRIVMLSRYHQETFAEAGVDPARTFIAPLCVDVDTFTPPEREPDGGPFRVAFCGQITQRKGLSYLIEGFQRAELGDDAELLFIGPPVGPATPWIGARGVRHVPAMPRVMLPEVLRTCHAVALPSLIEGFGATALEGMACGLPAIVSTNTFADDVVEDGADGWIVPIRDPDAIAERLRALKDDPDLRARMGAAARRKAEQYPWSRYREALRAGVLPLLGGQVEPSAADVPV